MSFKVNELIKKASVVLVLIIAFNINAQTKTIKNLIDYETKSNQISKRDNSMILLPHFEIPLNLLTKMQNNTLDKNKSKSLKKEVI